ncbi:MAG: ABC transporter ATP-binding protein [Woeseia sp.]|nr:ABC transporter ATP-binding protein [Woeseia sp.]
MERDRIRYRLIDQLRQLYRSISPRRRRHLRMFLLLQVFTGATEILGLGAIVPFLTALANASEMLSNQALAPYLAYANVTTPSQLIILFATLFAVAVIFTNVMRLTTLRVQMWLSARIGSELSVLLFSKMLHQDYEFHVNNNSSSMISEIVNDLNGTLSIIYNTLTLITQMLVVLFIVSTLLTLNPVAGFIMTILTGGAYFVVMRISKWRLRRNSKTISEGYVLLMKALQEGLGGIRDVLIDGTQKTFVDFYRKGDVPMRLASTDNQFIRMAPRFILEAIGISLLSIVAAFLAWQANDFSQVLPLLGTMALAASRLLPAVQGAFASLAGMHGSQESMLRTLRALSRPIDGEALMPQEAVSYGLKDRLEFKNIWFHYARVKDIEQTDQDWILRDVNLEIPANTTVALVGVTGSGKSTIADIALGLLKPQKGELLVDGHSLHEVDPRAWRATIAHVPQSIFLCDGTFSDNIAFGVPHDKVDMGQVRRAAAMALISEFIEARPSGYNTVVGERGIRLSGGQRQRIGIARALYKRASLIVFDEATSALDNPTEREVMNQIEALSGKVTVLLIAHRMSTVESADLIYEIGDGEVLHSGGYKQLLESSETFRSMVTSVPK